MKKKTMLRRSFMSMPQKDYLCFQRFLPNLDRDETFPFFVVCLLLSVCNIHVNLFARCVKSHYNKILMTATGHALIGTLIAARFQNPIISLPLCFASHIIADLIPHWDSGTHWREKTRERLIFEAVGDVLLGVGLSFILYAGILKQSNYSLMFSSIFVSQLPDWISAPYFMLNIKNPISKYVSKVQTQLNTKLDKPWGVVTQVATVVALYVLLFRVF